MEVSGPGFVRNVAHLRHEARPLSVSVCGAGAATFKHRRYFSMSSKELDTVTNRDP
jgi:hypothetical protein